MAQWGGRKQRSVCEAPVARRFEPCLLWAKILDPVGSGRASGLSLAWGTCHILGTQSQGTSVFISSSILMALIFPFPSLPTTYLMVLPSGSWECPLECVNCRAHLSLWVRAYLSQKKQLISQAQLTPAGRSTSVVCPAGAAPTVRPAGLRLPYGPAFSKSKEENQGWDQWKYWVSCSPSGNSQMKSMWPLVNPSPSLGNQTQRRGAGHAHSGHPSKILLFGGVTLSPEYSGLKSSSLQFLPCQSLRWNIKNSSLDSWGH